jgi:hypothetical protein
LTHFACAVACEIVGSRMPISTAMIPITTRSSISENARAARDARDARNFNDGFFMSVLRYDDDVCPNQSNTHDRRRRRRWQRRAPNGR